MSSILRKKFLRARNASSHERRERNFESHSLEAINNNLFILNACALSQHPNKQLAKLGSERLFTELAQTLLGSVLKDADLLISDQDVQFMYLFLLEKNQGFVEFFELDFELPATREYLQSLLNYLQQEQSSGHRHES